MLTPRQRVKIALQHKNPDRLLKISNVKGLIKEGLDADITIFDNLMNVKITIVEGEIKYNNL